jgi:hypothetical protein
MMRTPYTASYAGLTRVSITLREKGLAKKMDCRVKPGNDVGRFCLRCSNLLSMISSKKRPRKP